jgi:glyoxylase-like metal-dependent hydrolase (beta-lactamase superfamily II)
MTESIGNVSRRQLLALGGAAIAAAVAAPSAFAAAPLLGVSMPKFWRYKLGAFEITTLADSEAFIDGPYPIIGKNANEADVRALMRANVVPETRYQPGFSPTVINTGKELVLFDTGNGATGFIPRPQGGWLKDQLAPAGIKAEDVDIVVLSHGHPDHVAGIIEGDKPLFPNARYVIAAVEYDYWAPEGKHTGELEKLAAVFRANTKPVAERFSMLKPGDDVVAGIRSLAAPGHTPGHLAFVIESDGKQALFWGDCAHHHVASLARPDWHCVFDIDKEQAVATRRKIYEMSATERWPVIGYHMPFPSIGYVERRPDAGYRWVEHSFQLYP